MSQRPSLDGPADRDLQELHSARDLIRWGANRFTKASLFFGHGTDNAVDEALVLVLHALHLSPDVSDEILDGELARSEKQKVLKLFNRRIDERIPAAYLTGKAWFAELEFYVDQRVLIPRSPLAEWIERGFAPWLAAGEVRRIADIGTGSGCIAIACACVFTHARVDAADVSQDALKVARTNIDAHGLSDRVWPIQSDLYENLEGVYDLIVSNPPYVGAAELAAMPPEYRHEPLIGLAAGTDGLKYVRRLMLESVDYLTPHGVLVVEVGASRPALEKAFTRIPFTWLELTRGGENVFLLTREDLVETVASHSAP